jgi:cytochrome P450
MYYTTRLSVACGLCIGWKIVQYIEDWINQAKGYRIAQGPSRIPFFGNTLQILYNYSTRLEYFLELTRYYGSVFRFDLMCRQGTFVSTPELVEYVLKTNFDNYVKGDLITPKLMPLLGHGIFNSDGSTWKMQRKMASHMFSIRSMRDDMSKVFVRHGHQFLAKLKNEQEKEKNLFIDIQDYFSRFTLDSIGEIAFGHSIQSLQKQDVIFAQAFDQANRAIAFRFVNPFWRFTTYILPGEFELRKNCKILHDFSLDIIHKRRIMLERGEASDVLSRFIAMCDDDGKKFSDFYLRDVILNFIIAGRDTTSNSFTWMTYFLTQYTEIQEKVALEVQTVLKGEIPDFDTCKGLVYMEYVILETLRLCPSVPIVFKTAVNDDVLPTGHCVKKGDFVAYLPYVLNRNEVLFPDAELFKPERWENLNPSAFQYPTFQGGPRLCLGQHMAILEMKILMSMILQSYRIMLKPNHHPVRYNPSITLPVKHGLFIHLEPRV